MIWTWLTKQTIERKRITTKFTSWQGVWCFWVLRTGLFLVILVFAGWRSWWFQRRLLFVCNYLLSPHLTRCYGLLRTVLFKLNVYRPYHFSLVVYPSVLDDLPPLVAVALSSSCPDLLRVLIVLRNGLPRMMGGSYLSSPMSMIWKSSRAEYILVVGAWFHAGADKWLRPLCWRQIRCRRVSSKKSICWLCTQCLEHHGHPSWSRKVTWVDDLDLLRQGSKVLNLLDKTSHCLHPLGASFD